MRCTSRRISSVINVVQLEGLVVESWRSSVRGNFTGWLDTMAEKLTPESSDHERLDRDRDSGPVWRPASSSAKKKTGSSADIENRLLQFCFVLFRMTSIASRDRFLLHPSPDRRRSLLCLELIPETLQSKDQTRKPQRRQRGAHTPVAIHDSAIHESA